MASKPDHNPASKVHLDAIADDLVSVSHWGDFSYVSLPMFMPSGEPTTVRVCFNGKDFIIDDCGFSFRELESAGMERSFSQASKRLAERLHIETTPRTFRCVVSESELLRAISDVGVASHRLVTLTYERLENEDVSELEAALQERLENIFGTANVKSGEDVVGASTKPWPMSAVVHLESGLVVYQAVSPNGNAVNRTSTAFHDLGELDNPPRRVAVVKDKKAMGPNLNLLSQAGRVIEAGQPDDVFSGAAA